MASLLSNLVDKLAKQIHKTNGKYEHDNTKCETCGIKYFECCLKTQMLKMI